MSFDEFEKEARLYVVGALDGADLAAFSEARQQYGDAAEEFIHECRRLSAAFALSLKPQPPRSDAKQKLMMLIRKSAPGSGQGTNGDHASGGR
jgi:hypothetical protein